MSFIRGVTLGLTLATVGASSAFAAPLSLSVDNFPDLRNGFSCTPLFTGTATAAEVGRISCAKDQNKTACVIADDALGGTRAAAKLVAEKRLSSADARGTQGAMVIYGHRGWVAGTARAASKAQLLALKQKPYNAADAVVLAGNGGVAGRFAKATVVAPVNIGDKQYMLQDSNIIAGKDLDGDTSFYAIVTPGGEHAVVKYIRTDGAVELQCSGIPEELLGKYLVAPGLTFINK
jgi:hypothetical protein